MAAKRRGRDDPTIGPEAHRKAAVSADVGEPMEMTLDDYRRIYGATAGESEVKRNKFGAVKTEIDGHVFDSRAESRRYLYLKGELEAGRISHLMLHPRFVVVPAFTDNVGRKHAMIRYTADFQYQVLVDIPGGGKAWQTYVEDVKGGKATQTRDFKIRWALVIRDNPAIIFNTVEA